MHESHLVEPVIKGIAEHAKREGAQKVTKVHLKVGAFTGCKEESLRETFRVLAEGTMLEGASVEMTFFPGSRVEVVSFDVE